jgi:hypothetical protein
MSDTNNVDLNLAQMLIFIVFFRLKRRAIARNPQHWLAFKTLCQLQGIDGTAIFSYSWMC